MQEELNRVDTPIQDPIDTLAAATARVLLPHSRPSAPHLWAGWMECVCVTWMEWKLTKHKCIQPVYSMHTTTRLEYAGSLFMPNLETCIAWQKHMRVGVNTQKAIGFTWKGKESQSIILYVTTICSILPSRLFRHARAVLEPLNIDSPVRFSTEEIISFCMKYENFIVPPYLI